MHHVSLFLETNSYIKVLCIDFSTAFDIVDHEIVLLKLVALGLPPAIVDSIISFLTDHSQMCKIVSIISLLAAISRRIIQGSGMDPLLYFIMEGDVHLISVINLLFKYENDTNLSS